jgi:hypothetical protein
LPAAFHVLRPVDAAERDAIRDAQALFDSFAVSWQWNRLVGAAQDLQQALAETVAATGKAAGTINPADAERVDRAFRSLST